MSEFLIEDILPKNEFHLFGGPSGSNKTTWLFQMIETWQRGENIFTHVSHPEPYVYVSMDRSLRSVHRTIKRLGLNPNKLPIISAVDLGLTTFEAVMKKCASLHPDATTIFIDGFATLVPGGKINDYGIVAAFLSSITRLCSNGLTIIGIIHATKTKENEKYLNPRERLLGSVAWAAFTETIFYIEPVEPDSPTDNLRRLEIMPRNSKHESYEMELNSNGVLVPSVHKAQQDTKTGTFLNSLDESTEFTVEDFQLAASLSKSYVHKAISRWLASGQIARVSKGVYRKEWTT